MGYNNLMARQWTRLVAWAVLTLVSAPFALKYLALYYQLLRESMKL